MKSYIYKLLLLSIPLVSVMNFTMAQQLKGVVLEANQKGAFEPLVGVNVYWSGTSIATSTNENGIFSIDKNASVNKLVFSYVGYEKDTVEIINQDEIKVYLKTINQLQEVEVAGGRGSTYISSLDPIKTQTMTEGELLKAACCNLSESFETNPSVDVSYSDAVTGMKQIQMLGLSGIYTQITTENLPGIRGLASNNGLTYIPGPWIESIQVTKGIGSVANGYESITGQINVELKKPEKMDRLFFNSYVNSMGRIEGNLNLSQKVSKNWTTGLLLHSNYLNNKIDMNKDKFMDIPLGAQFNIVNRWKYDNGKGILAQVGVKALKDDRQGGQLAFDPEEDKGTTNNYGLEINTNRIEVFGKLGYVFPKKQYQSIGLMVSGLNHEQDTYFGLNAYDGSQKSFYANLIYQSIISNTNHKFRLGLSYLFDQYDETYKLTGYSRIERVPGAFVEYTYTYPEKFSLVAGLRVDQNSIYGTFVTPRVHAKYDISPNSILRASFGRGQRTANIFAENLSIMASSRNSIIYSPENKKHLPYGLSPEIAWNSGLNFTKYVYLFGRQASINLDLYRTDFQNQVVVNMDRSSHEVNFYNLSGKSYSNSFQAEVGYELLPNLEAKLAYRWYDVKTKIDGKMLQRPYVAKDRFFVNLGYKTPNEKWRFDYTFQWLGKKRLPSSGANPQEHVMGEYSQSYYTMNAQVTKVFKWLELYTGVENLTDFTQHDLIVSPDEPFGPHFDSSIVWGPVIGRMFYGGLRFKIGSPQSEGKH